MKQHGAKRRNVSKSNRITLDGHKGALQACEVDINRLITTLRGLVPEVVHVSSDLGPILDKEATKIERDFKVVVNYEANVADRDAESELMFEFTLAGGQTVQIRRGNLITDPVDVIVNAANNVSCVGDA